MVFTNIFIQKLHYLVRKLTRDPYDPGYLPPWFILSSHIPVNMQGHIVFFRESSYDYNELSLHFEIDWNGVIGTKVKRSFTVEEQKVSTSALQLVVVGSHHSSFAWSWTQLNFLLSTSHWDVSAHCLPLCSLLLLVFQHSFKMNGYHYLCVLSLRV